MAVYSDEIGVTATQSATSVTASANDNIIEITDTSAARTVTLPPAASARVGRILTIKDSWGAAYTNVITVATTGLTPDSSALTWQLSRRTTGDATVRLMTTGALASCTASGSGVGKILTEVGNGALTIDSVAAAGADIVLIKDQANAVDNGIYTVTDAGGAGTPFILTRKTTFDAVTEVLPGYRAKATAGTVNTGLVYALAGGIADNTTTTIATNYGAVALYSDGTNWHLVDRLGSDTDNSWTIKGPLNIDDSANAATMYLKDSGVIKMGFFRQGGNSYIFAQGSTLGLNFIANGSDTGFQVDFAGNVVAGIQAAIATNATDGFLYIPTCAGTPSGTPTAKTGKATTVYDSTNLRFRTYSGGWQEFIHRSVTTGITAGATQTQAGATALTTEDNRVTVVATDDDGVKLPAAVVGRVCHIVNADAAQRIKIWPASGDAIDTGAVDAADANTLAAAGQRTYVALDSTTWYTRTL